MGTRKLSIQLNQAYVARN